jgi:hypothetical protein
MLRAVRCLLPVLVSAFSVCLAACAADAPAAAPPSEWRVMVKLVQPSTDADAIARRASRAAGVAARYLAAVSPQWHSLGLACGDEARCTQALQRLRADTAFFETVERDERRRAHPQPS